MTKNLRLIMMLTAVLATASPTFAQLAQPQLRQGRPTRGLFGGGNGKTAQQLILNASFGAAHDWQKASQPTLAPAPGEPANAGQPWAGSYATGMLQLSYSLSRGRFSAGANAGMNANMKPNRSNNNLLRSIGAGANTRAQLTTSTAVMASYAVSEQPHNSQLFFGNWFGSDTSSDPLLDLGGATSQTNRFSQQGAVSFSQSVTKRVALNASYSASFFDGFPGFTTSSSMTKSGQAGASVALFKGAWLRFGYGHTSAKYGDQAPVSYGGPSFDGGLSFDRPISLTRRTTLNFGVGVTGARDQVRELHYFLTGNASLTHEIGRSWTAAANYRRGVDFNQGLSVPVILDTASVGISGDIGRRIQVNAGGGGSWGSAGVGAGGSPFKALTGNASLRTALTQMLGVTLSYGYRQYRFDDSAVLLPGLRPSFERHTLRISMDLFLPIIMRRSANAAG